MESTQNDVIARPSTDRPRRSRRVLVLLVAAVVAVEAAVLAYVFLAEQAALWRDRGKTEVMGGTITNNRFVYVAEGVSLPAMKVVAGAGLSDEELVFAVEISGKPRAYRVSAMKGREQHIINDVIEGTPVSVTYCDAADCVRGFVGEPSACPLDIALGGLVDGNRLVLRINDRDYFQDDGNPTDPSRGAAGIPYEPIEIRRLKWKDWREAHPDGEVFAGDFDSTR